MELWGSAAREGEGEPRPRFLKMGEAGLFSHEAARGWNGRWAAGGTEGCRKGGTRRMHLNGIISSGWDGVGTNQTTSPHAKIRHGAHL